MHRPRPSLIGVLAAGEPTGYLPAVLGFGCLVLAEVGRVLGLAAPLSCAAGPSCLASLGAFSPPVLSPRVLSVCALSLGATVTSLTLLVLWVSSLAVPTWPTPPPPCLPTG